MPIRQFLIIFLSVFFLPGCITYVKHSPKFASTIQEVKTIAVLPADVRVYNIKTGGIQEEMDEWSFKAQGLIEQALTKHLGERYKLELKFISKDWLKENHKILWSDQKALYEAVTNAAFMHAYNGENAFPDKVKNFDYTLGPDVKALADALGVTTLLFVNGYDYEVSTGRVMMEFWNQILGAAAGVSIIYSHPSFLALSLVDGTSGDLLWLSVNNTQVEYSFKSEKHMDALVEWETREFYPKNK